MHGVSEKALLEPGISRRLLGSAGHFECILLKTHQKLLLSAKQSSHKSTNTGLGLAEDRGQQQREGRQNEAVLL